MTCNLMDSFTRGVTPWTGPNMHRERPENQHKCRAMRRFAPSLCPADWMLLKVQSCSEVSMNAYPLLMED